MRGLGVLLLSGVALAGAGWASGVAVAQEPAGAESGGGVARSQSGAAGQSAGQVQTIGRNGQVVPTHDGGVSEVLQSIVVGPKAGAPFTLTLETEWEKQLYDGGTITFVNKRRIARDASGRIYQERWALVPKNDERVKSLMTVIQIMDPNKHTLYNCWYVDKPNTCVLLEYGGSTEKIYKPASPPTGEWRGGGGSSVHEDLGKQFIQGVLTEGTRDRMTYNAGSFGNDRPVTVENEFWWSPALGLNLLSIKKDPRIGKQTFTVTSVLLGEPDPSLFALPAGFTVVDHRSSEAIPKGSDERSE
jgi:hypothetical protein